MRYYALIGIAAGEEQTVLSNLPGVEYKNGSDGKGERLEYTREGRIETTKTIINEQEEEEEITVVYTYPERKYALLIWKLATNIDVGPESNGADGNWDFWLLAADSKNNPTGHWKWLTRAQRYLHRRSSEMPGWVFGPYSLAYCMETWPTQTEALLKTDGAWSFPIIAGDNHPSIVAVDYRPTSQEIDEDTDADPTILFPSS